MGGGRGGRPRPIVWGGEWNDEKINNIKCIVAFGGHWSIILHTTTNQKWAGAVEERVEKRDECGGGQRDANAPRLRVEGERGRRTASLTIARCLVMTLSAMTPIRR